MAIAEKGLTVLDQQGSQAYHLQVVSSSSEQTSQTEALTQAVSGSVTVGREALKWTLEVPQIPIYEGLGIFTPGFGGFKATSRAPRKALAHEGIASVSYGPVRQCDSSAVQRLLHSEEAHVATIEAVVDAVKNDDEATKALGYANINPGRLWLILHSMAGKSGVTFATKYPESVEGVTHLSTIGLGSPTIVQLVRSTPMGIVPAIRHELFPYAKAGEINPTLGSLWQAIDYYARNPLRTAGEAYTCLRADTRADIVALGQAGIQNDYLGAAHDVLVCPDDSVARYFNQFARMPGAGHLFPQLKSRAMAHQASRLILGKAFDFSPATNN